MTDAVRPPIKFVPAFVVEAPNVTHYRVALALSKADFQFTEGQTVNEMVVRPPLNMSLEEAQARITELIDPILNALQTAR